MATVIYCPYFITFLKRCSEDCMKDKDIEKIKNFCKNDNYIRCGKFSRYLADKPRYLGIERRLFPRVSVGLNLRIENKEGFRVNIPPYLMNISSGGLRFAAKVQYLLSDSGSIKRFLNMSSVQAMDALAGTQSNINNVLNMAIKIDSLEDPLVIKGFMVWGRRRPDSPFSDFGVRFSAIDQATASKLSSFVGSMLELHSSRLTGNAPEHLPEYPAS